MLIPFLLQGLVGQGCKPLSLSPSFLICKIGPPVTFHTQWSLMEESPRTSKADLKRAVVSTRIPWSPDLSTRLHAVRKPRPWERPTWKLTDASVLSSADLPESIQRRPLTLRKATLELLLPCGSLATLIPQEAEAPSSRVTEL